MRIQDSVTSRVYSCTLAFRCASLLIMLATASFAPASSPVTLSQTSMIYSQFSEVRFSSVALAIGEGYQQLCGIPMTRALADGREDDLPTTSSKAFCCARNILRFAMYGIQRLQVGRGVLNARSIEVAKRNEDELRRLCCAPDELVDEVKLSA